LAIALSLTALTANELEVVRRMMAATFQYLDFDFETRLGVSEEAMQSLLEAWPDVDDSDDDGDACLAINNSLNDLLNGIGISDVKASGADCVEIRRIYKKWASARGWKSTGIR
jgi:hypothetical protein